METSNGGGSGDESAHVPPPLASDPAPRPAAMATIEKKKHIFVLSGQSNMSGRGGVRARRWDGVVPSACGPRPPPSPPVGGARWRTRASPPRRHRHRQDLRRRPRHGLRQRPPPPPPRLLLVRDRPRPCAVGAPPSGWEPGTHLYAQMVRRAKEAVAGGGELRAVLWYQGESDATEHAAPSIDPTWRS
ncbi:putative carbohydrate esterase [Ananas comosus]|uniref:Putative carbohydrate esterase n=1 Tax=Ananas comosus TaxID=4615 RepID=A0A199V2W0_ANACO|nr:putative carbohydrate esterase [Ananas comosus]